MASGSLLEAVDNCSWPIAPVCLGPWQHVRGPRFQHVPSAVGPWSLLSFHLILSSLPLFLTPFSVSLFSFIPLYPSPFPPPLLSTQWPALPFVATRWHQRIVCPVHTAGIPPPAPPAPTNPGRLSTLNPSQHLHPAQCLPETTHGGKQAAKYGQSQGGVQELPAPCRCSNMPLG